MLGVTNARVYISGDNLFTFRADKRMKDFDPEVASGRGYSLGIKKLYCRLSFSF